MSLRTRLFGKKVDGDELEDLFEMIGEPLPKYQGDNGWSFFVYAKRRFIPTHDGVIVDIYLFSGKFHSFVGAQYPDGTTRRTEEIKFPAKHYVKEISLDPAAGRLAVVDEELTAGRLSDVVEHGLTLVGE